MGKFTTGMVAGGVLMAMGAFMAMSDKKTKRKMKRYGRKLANHATNLMADMEMF